jgi:phage shock protein PspC (stress-responsive transcriptional regulator)
MKLTEQQESLISRYTDELAGQLEKRLPEADRRRMLYRFRRELNAALEATGRETPEDTDVLMLLKQRGTPAEAAVRLIARHSEETPAMNLPAPEKRVWLGVCAALADRFDMPARTVRIGAVVAGLLTGPLALILYTAIYLTLYFTGAKEQPRIAWLRVLWRAAVTFIIALALHHGGRYAVQLIYKAHELLLKRPVPSLGEWGWLEWQSGSMLFWTILIAVPFAILSGMPLANAWDYSLKRVAQAVLALYGAALSFGIASILAGIILNFVDEFTGGTMALPF